MNINNVRILNSSLQFVTLIARFLFIFFLAKYLNPMQVGYYGIFIATVSYILYFVGLDYYIFVSREIINKKAEERGRLLKGQIVISGVLYLIITPFAIFFLIKSDWPGYLVWWFFPILILEHFNQEMSRLLVVLSEQISATIITFIRQGAWSIIMVIAMILDINARNLDLVMAVWTTSGICAAILGIQKLRQLKTSGWAMPIEWDIAKKGIITSLSFLLGTLALRGVNTFDRYWLEQLAGIEVVGAYVLLLGIASTLLIFLESALFSFTYPELIKLNDKKDYYSAHKVVKKLFIQTLCICIFFGVSSFSILPYVLIWIGNSLYINSINLYPLILFAIMMSALSMVPHYGLYALGIDKPIIFSHLLSMIVFIIVTWLVSKINLSNAVPVGFCSATGVILIIKTSAYFLFNPKNIENSF